MKLILPEYTRLLPDDAMMCKVEVAKMLGVATCTLDVKIKAGEFPKANLKSKCWNKKRTGKRYWSMSVLREFHKQQGEAK